MTIDQLDTQSVAEDLRPELFSSADGTKLFGCLHMPTSMRVQKIAIVILPALIFEYERSHRALRTLAAYFARRDYAAFRFDYRGCGDSEGDLSSVDPHAWHDDVAAAIDHAKRASGAKQVCLIGMRFGGVMALHAASRDDVCGVVAWHSVSPEAMVTHWKHAEENSRRAHGWDESTGEMVLGWRAPTAFVDAIQTVPMPSHASDKPVMAVRHTSMTSPEEFPMPGAYTEEDRGPAYWKEESEDALVSIETLNMIADWVDGQVS